MSTAHATAADPLPLLDVHGRRRAPCTYPGARAGQPPKNKGRKYPPSAFTNADFQRFAAACLVPTSHAGSHATIAGHRLLAICVVMFRADLRVQEALDFYEADLDRNDRTITVRCGKGGKRRVVGMDEWGWRHLDDWLRLRADLPPGPVFCTIVRGIEGRAWHQAELRRSMRRVRDRAGITRRCAPHQLRHGFAVGCWREGIDVLTIQRALGHSRLDVTQAYLVSLGADDLIKPVTTRKPPMVPLSV